MVMAPERQNGLWNAGDPTDDTAPRLEWVLALKHDYQEYYRPFHDQCRAEEDYYFQRYTPPTPDGFKPVIPATARAIVDVATDHVDVDNISIDVPPPSQRAKARAERQKKFLEGFWLNVKKPVKRTAVKHAFTYGVAFLKIMWDADRWPDMPTFDRYDGDEDAYREALRDFMDARGIAFPFALVNVNPKHLLWDDSRTRIKWCIEFYEYQVRDLRRRYPEWATTKADGDMATWMEYWDEEWFGYIVDNEWVEGPHRHGYGFNSYVQLLPSRALDWGDGPPQERFQGILYPVHNLLDEEAHLATMYSAIIRQFAWPALDFTGPKAQADAAAADYELFGAKNVVPTGVVVSQSPRIAPPQEVMSELAQVQTMIEEATFPNVVRGIRPKGVSTGFGVSVLAGMGRLVFQGVASGVGNGFEEINARALLLVQNKAKGRVTVHGYTDVGALDQTIGPDDVRGWVANRVILKAEAPEERERESLLAMRLNQARIISLYETQRRVGITNPLEEQNQMAAEELMLALRPVQAALAQQRLGLFDQLAQAASLTGQGTNMGNMFQPGQSQGSRLDEFGIQRQRVQTRAANDASPGVFPSGMGGLNLLGGLLGTPGGGAVGMPSGQTIGA